jgi:hypothetical protein
MQMKDIQAGQSYACKFRTTTFLDERGQPVRANISVGQAHPGTPGEYTGLGVIRTRDIDQQLVELVDTVTGDRFVVSWDDCWDIDTVEYLEDQQ